MKIHKAGRKIILTVFVLVVLFVLACELICGPDLRIKAWLYVPLTFMTILTVLFFRIPARKMHQDDSVIMSAADGMVVAIEEVQEDEYFKQKRKVISVFMSVHNMHVNYSPVSGMIRFFRHHPGKHFLAWQPKASTENEHTTIVIDHPIHGPVLMRQIAGAFARRIIFNHREGSLLGQCEEIGIIKFGSRVDVFLPVDVKVQVTLHQKVKAGVSILASF